MTCVNVGTFFFILIYLLFVCNYENSRLYHLLTVIIAKEPMGKKSTYLYYFLTEYSDSLIYILFFITNLKGTIN
jgi:hypothetical protein